MRGVNFLDTAPMVVDGMLMSKYNQLYSEIDNIPTKTVIFLMRLAEAEDAHQEAQMKKLKNKR